MNTKNTLKTSTKWTRMMNDRQIENLKVFLARKSKTPFTSEISKDKWKRFIDYTISGTPNRTISKMIGINHGTICVWKNMLIEEFIGVMDTFKVCRNVTLKETDEERMKREVKEKKERKIISTIPDVKKVKVAEKKVTPEVKPVKIKRTTRVILGDVIRDRKEHTLSDDWSDIDKKKFILFTDYERDHPFPGVGLKEWEILLDDMIDGVPLKDSIKNTGINRSTLSVLRRNVISVFEILKHGIRVGGKNDSICDILLYGEKIKK